MAVFNLFMYESLKYLYPLSDDTKIYIYEPSGKIYIIKTVSIALNGYYKKISEMNSPYLSKILFIHHEGEDISIVREYISGETISERLKRDKTISPSEAVKYILQICKGLSCLHKNGLVHRDINPQNIIITSDGNIKIIDFGIVRSYKKESSSDTVILGTPGYAAPEQFGFSQSDDKTDIYAVGVLFNVMLTENMPKDTIASGIYGDIIKKCVEIDANKRYCNINELILSIENKNLNGGKADKFFNLIPGLRSENSLIFVLASIGYFFALVLTIMHFGFLPYEPSKIIFGILSYVFSTVIPFFSFHNFLDIWNKIPFTAGSSLKVQKSIFNALGAFSLFIGMVLFSHAHPSSV